MTREEAARVAQIACTADGGCSDCAVRLLQQLAREFPDHKDVFEGAYAVEFGRTFTWVEVDESEVAAIRKRIGYHFGEVVS